MKRINLEKPFQRNGTILEFSNRDFTSTALLKIDFFKDTYRVKHQDGVYDYAFYLRPIHSVVYAVSLNDRLSLKTRQIRKDQQNWLRLK